MVDSFAKLLVSVRKLNGFASARAFFLAASKRRVLDFNYSYYMRIESGKAVPSAAIVNSVVSLFPKEQAEQLVTKYCEELFPGYRVLFAKSRTRSIQENPKESKKDRHQTLLTKSQILTLARSPQHYYLFLLLTLARSTLSVESIEQMFSGGNALDTLADLGAVKLVLSVENRVKSASSEFKFPPADSDEIKHLYIQFDQWDRSLPEKSSLSEHRKKFILRRTSPRFIELIDGLLSQLEQTIKVSDEKDFSENDEVFIFDYRFSTGRWPG